MPASEPGSSVHTDCGPASRLRRAVGRQETRFWALTKLRDLGAAPLPPLAVLCFAKGRGLLSPLPGQAVDLCCPCFSKREKRNEGME